MASFGAGEKMPAQVPGAPSVAMKRLPERSNDEVVRARDGAHLALVEPGEVGATGRPGRRTAGRSPTLNEVEPGSPPPSVISMTWPKVLTARGLAASVPGLPVVPALRVVGARHVHLLGGRAGLDVLGAVHLGGAQRGARRPAARMSDVGLAT